MKWIWFVSLLVLPLTTSAQTGTPVSHGAMSLAMGRTYVNHLHAHSLFGNQAGLVGGANLNVHLSAEQRFLKSDLSVAAFGISKKLSDVHSIGLSVSNFGIDAYKEQRLALMYARKLADNLRIGAQFHLLHFRIDEYGSKTLANLELGVQADVSREWTIGAHVVNPARLDLTEDTTLPTILSAGVHYKPSKKANFHLEVEKEIDFGEQIKAGVSYAFIDILQMRVGFQTNPSNASFGLGLHLKSGWSVDLGFQSHQHLDVTPGISIIYSR